MSMNNRDRQTREPSNGKSKEPAQWIPGWFLEDQPEEKLVPFTNSRTTVYAVIVHDDEVHACRDFVEILEQVFGYAEPAAYSLTQEIAKTGRVVVWKGFRDDAERKAQQAREYQPRWRRSESVTAPQRISEYVYPFTITVELAKRVPSNSLSEESQGHGVLS